MRSVWLVAPDQSLKSGFVGPFGGFWAQSSTELEDNFASHLSNLERLASDAAVGIMLARLPPMDSGLLNVVDDPNSVRRFGWKIVGQETDHLVTVSSGLPELSRLRQRDIARAESLGFSSMSGLEFLEEAVLVVEANRMAKMVPLTLSLDKAEALARLLGEEIRVSIVRNNESRQPVAGSLSVMVQAGVGYVIQWGHFVETGSTVSPMAMLAEEVFSDLVQQGANKILLGSSSVSGVVNPGLARFKESLGATPTPKWVIQKIL